MNNQEWREPPACKKCCLEAATSLSVRGWGARCEDDSWRGLFASRQAIPDTMRLALMEPYVGPIIHCGESLTNKHGRTGATCTLPAGHTGPHTDTHGGHRWNR